MNHLMLQKLKLTRRATRAAVCAVAIVLVAAAWPAGAQDDQKENFEALAVHMGSGPSGQAPFLIEVDRWSTEEEASALFEILEKEGASKLADALGKEKSVGHARFPTMRSRYPSTELNFARQFERNGKRVVILATNRPISFVGAMRQDSRALDYDLTLIELELDSDGKGDGVLSIGIEIGYDADKKQIVTKNWSSSPVQLKNVRKK